MHAADLSVLLSCQEWLARDRQVALLTVMRTWGSSPRPPGAMMAIRDDGVVSGSVSGGCIEDNLIDTVRTQGIAALCPAGLPAIAAYGVDAGQARRFGLPCGGTLQLMVEPLGADSRIDELVERLQRRESVQREIDLRDGRVTLGSAASDAGPCLREDRFACVLGPRHRLIVIGAGPLSRCLCDIALGLDFDITVCDPREECRAQWNVPGVRLVHDMPHDVVAAARPDARTAIVALTHDPELDDPALVDALQSDAFYVGALGSQASNARRMQRLREHFGLDQARLSRLRGPAGVHIGSRTPAEIALSILAEIVACKNGVSLPGEAAMAIAKNTLEHAAAPASGARTLP